MAMNDGVGPIEQARADGRHEEAAALCRAAISDQPENASLRILLGWIALDNRAYDAAIAAARDAVVIAGHDPVAVARLLSFTGAMSGRWSVAAEALAALSAVGDAATRAIVIEIAPAFLASINDFQRDADFWSAVDSFENAPDLSAAAAETLRGIRRAASISYLAIGDGEAAIAVFAGHEVGRPATLVGDPPRPVLMTSLMQSRLDIQKAAVTSWRQMGFDVASLNAAHEIPALSDEFDDVTFHAATRDAGNELGRPLVYLDDMLMILSNAGVPMGGIINSDIVFANHSTDVMTKLCRTAQTALLFGNRVDVDALDMPQDSSSQSYLFGYDWFLFNPGNVPHADDGTMVFGAPWWDLWLPFHAKAKGLDVVNVRLPLALHQRHATRWLASDHQEMAIRLSKQLIADAQTMVPESRFQRRAIQLASALKVLGPQAFTDRSTLDWLASLLRGLVQLEATPLIMGDGHCAHRFWDEDGRL